MTQEDRPDQQIDVEDTDDTQQRNVPKPESSSEYEGASDREPTGNAPVETKTETSSSSGQ